MKKLTIITLFSLLSTTVFGSKIDVTNSYLGIVTMTEYAKKAQVETDGTLNKFEWNPGLLFGFEVPLSESFNFYPEFGFLLPTHTEGGDITRMTYFLWGNFSYNLKDFYLKLGAGYNFTRISSKGGTKSLGNGNGTSTFYLPEYSATSYNAVVQAGLEYYPSRRISIRGDSSIYNVWNSEKRAFSYMFSVLYHIDPSRMRMFN